MNQTQKDIHDFMQSAGWQYWTPHQILARITEEVGELARVINHEYGPKKRKADEIPVTLSEELGDILYALACLANREGINLDEALAHSHDKVIQRDSNRFN